MMLGEKEKGLLNQAKRKNHSSTYRLSSGWYLYGKL
jgi:hypothetical protein